MAVIELTPGDAFFTFRSGRIEWRLPPNDNGNGDPGARGENLFTAWVTETCLLAARQYGATLGCKMRKRFFSCHLKLRSFWRYDVTAAYGRQRGQIGTHYQ